MANKYQEKFQFHLDVTLKQIIISKKFSDTHTEKIAVNENIILKVIDVQIVLMQVLKDGKENMKSKAGW